MTDFKTPPEASARLDFDVRGAGTPISDETWSAVRPPEQLAAAYFDAWRLKDGDALAPLLHPEIKFVGVMGGVEGVDAAVRGLRGMFAMTESVQVQHRWVDGQDVITWFELRLRSAPTDPLAVVNWSHVHDGRIDLIRVTFDPRPLLAGD
jgi:hypothetical protein